MYIDTKNTASFFKSFKRLSRDDARKKAKKINQACKIYDRFDDILSNLKSCPHIDIRRLSLNQLNMAFDPKWCVMYNEVIREQRGDDVAGDIDLVYNERDFSEFLQLIKGHPVYRSINKSSTNNYGKREITALFHRPQRALLSGR